MNTPEPGICINVDVTNPGQFFACCGLLELADRLWPDVEGWFDEANQRFYLGGSASGSRVRASQLIQSLVACEISNTMPSAQVNRRNELGKLLKLLRKDIKAANGEAKKKLQSRLNTVDEEKKRLDGLWRERPIVVGSPFNLRVDWFLDTYSGGSKFKTWAGQQSVIDIARAMSEGVAQGGWGELEPEKWLCQPSNKDDVPFNFDSNLGPQASSLDVGYSLDALNMSIRTRPMIEFAGLIGLQRFRPNPVGRENRYRYRAWHVPLTLQVAAIAACAILPLPDSTDFEFRLLYRTKYLKSFLPATQIGD